MVVRKKEESLGGKNSKWHALEMKDSIKIDAFLTTVLFIIMDE